MPFEPYRTGLVTLDGVDLTKVHGAGTGWGFGNGNVWPGDTLELDGARGSIESVEGDEEHTLSLPWAGAPFTDAEYIIRPDSPLRYAVGETAVILADLLSDLRLRGDAVIVNVVEEFGVNDPPVSGYAEGDRLVVGTVPTGIFSSHSNEIARKTASAWEFTVPSHGFIVIARESVPNIARNWDSDSAEWQQIGGLLSAPRWAGAWDIATNYTAGQTVVRLNKWYTADIDNVGFAPESNPAKWTKSLDIGVDGGGIAIALRYRTATTAATADVAGQLNFDNASPASASKLYLSKTDLFTNEWSVTLASLSVLNTGARKGRLRLIAPGDPSQQFMASVTAIEEVDDHYEFTLATPELGASALSDNLEVVFLWQDAQEGVQGDQGAQGTRGATGGPISIAYTFSTETADADPTPGMLRLGTATQNVATVLRADVLNSALASVVGILDAVSIIGTGSPIALFSLDHATTPETKFLKGQVTAYASPTGYRNLTIEILAYSAANPFADLDPVTLNLYPVLPGEIGATGATGPQGLPFRPDHTEALIADRDDWDFADAGTIVLIESDSTNDNKPTIYVLITPAVVSPPSDAVWSGGFTFIPEANASSVVYDNATSGLTADNAQDAIDEVLVKGTILEAAPIDINSDAITDIGALASVRANVLGTTDITSFGSVPNKFRIVNFIDGTLTLFDGPDLILLVGVDRKINAGDVGVYASDHLGKWHELSFSSGSVNYTSLVDGNDSLDPTESIAILTVALTAPRTVTLPQASSTLPGAIVRIVDGVGGLSATNYLKVEPTDPDFLNGNVTGASTVKLTFAYAQAVFVSDGVSKWYYGDGFLAGTFTPNFTFATPGTMSKAFSQQAGFYHTVGNLVVASIWMTTSSFTLGTGSGVLSITNFPFTSAPTSGIFWFCSVVVGGVTKAGYTDFNAVMLGNATTASLTASGSGVAPSSVAASDMPTGGTINIRLTMIYQKAS